MKQDNTLNRIIGEKLLEANKSDREPSGKLSASKLFWPLQWQILTTKLKLKSEFDEYTLRKFQRGKDVEDWFVGQIETKETQKFLEYRGVIGYCDAIVNTENWDTKIGTVPLEVKSVTNMKFKRIEGNEADEGHILQNAFYGLAFGSKHHAITYIASDDYRIYTTIYKTKDSKEQIDNIIDEYEAAIKLDTIPKFEPRIKWQTNLKYNNFPEYAGMSVDELRAKYIKLTE